MLAEEVIFKPRWDLVGTLGPLEPQISVQIRYQDNSNGTQRAPVLVQNLQHDSRHCTLMAEFLRPSRRTEMGIERYGNDQNRTFLFEMFQKSQFDSFYPGLIVF